MVATAIGCSSNSSQAALPSAKGTTPAVATSVAMVVAVGGDVRIRRTSTGPWVPLGGNTAIGPDDTVQALGTGSATLRVASTGAELVLEANTTMRFDATSRPQPLAGRIVARIGETAVPARLELALPPGLLVLTTDLRNQHVAEAAIEIADSGTTLEMRHGSGQIIPPSGRAIVVGEHERARFDAAGAIRPEPAQDIVHLVEPTDGAHLRVRQNVTLRWTPLAAADAYRISIETGPVLRQLDVPTSPAVVPLVTGHYVWSVQPLHADIPLVAAPRRAFDVEVDNRAPELLIETPGPGATVIGPTIQIVGRSKPGAAIEIAHARTTADTNGRFALVVPISHGLSNLVITARDDLGNQKRVARSVVWD